MQHDTTRKSYEQMCSLAAALDLIGDRWTLLIVRELLGGTARFNEIQAGLPGISPKLLTDRLQRLESDGLVRNTGTDYSLTDKGAGLRATLEPLALWGASVPRVCPPIHERSIRTNAMALQLILRRVAESLPDDERTLELDVDGELLDITLGANPTATARASNAPQARARITAHAMRLIIEGQSADPASITHLTGDEPTTNAFTTALA